MGETRESQAGLRYEARRAARTGGAIELLALIPPQEFSQWGGVQAAMEEEARLRAEAMVAQASSAIVEEAGLTPSITVRQGDPVKAVTEFLKERDDIAALVLGAAAEGDRKSTRPELQSLMRISYAVFCLKKKKKTEKTT